MTAIRPLPFLVSSLVLCGLAPLAGAQSPLRQDRLNAVLSTPIPGAQLAATFGLNLVGEIPGFAVSLERPPGMPPDKFQRILNQIDSLPETLFAELDHRLQTPEFEGCAIQGQVGIQQCTIGFVSGDPADNCEPNQWLGQLGLGQILPNPATAQPIVAVLDSGIDPSVTTIANALFHSGYDHVLDQIGGYDLPDGIDQDLDGLIDEAFGHGTHVTSTILAIAPQTLILPVRVVDADGVGWGFDIAEGLLTAVQNGVDMVNMSLSMAAPSKFISLMLALTLSNGIEVFIAAGNTGSEGALFPASFTADPTGTYVVPANMPNGVIGVAALGIDHALANFSAYGDGVDLCGLGMRVCAEVPGGLIQSWQGTSMACATTTGIASLVRARIPVAYTGPMGELLIETAKPVDAFNPDQAGKLGAGAFDVFAAIAKGSAP